MKVLKRYFTIVLASCFVWVGYVGIALAQMPVNQVAGEGADLIEWIVTILRFLIGLTGILAAAVLIFNGIMYITASGDENKIQKATKGITYAIIGLIIAAISFLIVNFVAQTLEDTKGGTQQQQSRIDVETTQQLG